MKATPNNPPNNKLGAGTSEVKIGTAVSKSGYPLQTRVANFLRQHFNVQEEWSYIDDDTKELRAIDLLAEARLFDPHRVGELRVRPTLDLVIECKKSELPYLFFLSPGKPWVPYFPLLAGLFKHEISITTDDDPSSWTFHIPHALGLHSHKFISQDPKCCMSFTRCVRKGSNIVLSGSDPFHSLVMPILKAMHHFQLIESPPTTAMYFDLHLTIGIGLLEAPMVGVRVSKDSHELVLVPWVRVIRHEPDKIPDWLSRTRLFAIDIVHKDFFQQYLNKHLLPFSREFSKLAIKHQQVLASGKAFARNMGKDSFNDIEQRLEPRNMITGAHRVKAALKNIFQVATRRK